jgi:hypothetical protein
LAPGWLEAKHCTGVPVEVAVGDHVKVAVFVEVAAAVAVFVGVPVATAVFVGVPVALGLAVAVALPTVAPVTIASCRLGIAPSMLESDTACALRLAVLWVLRLAPTET